ncbi:MAG TPA: carboxypeptidase-like regulatory domain-containing protein, partial [Terriglobia bacterium]|nr:carboxypeptidase-like regulatory domain-containing protein [Terriglobia bacterium]
MPTILMLALLFSLSLLIQGIPAKPAESGTITGMLKTELGAPAVGVRVAAMAVPESATVINSLSALSSIDETDAQGHFHLENIPQGRYYVTAGRVDYPTYFPGTQDITAGRIIAIKAGDIIPGIDFVMSSIAVRPLGNSFGLFGVGFNSTPSLGIGINVSVEGGGPLPVFSPAGFSTIQLLRTTDNQATTMPLTASSISVAVPTGVAPEYRVKVENLPGGYTLKSIVYNATDITNGTLKLSSVATPPTGVILSTLNVPLPNGVFAGNTAQLLPATLVITLASPPRGTTNS